MEAHEEALIHALSNGINLIDTSANYTGGDSEALAGRVVGKLISAGRLARQETVAVSKVGYLQGKNYELSRQRADVGRPFSELALSESETHLRRSLLPELDLPQELRQPVESGDRRKSWRRLQAGLKAHN